MAPSCSFTYVHLLGKTMHCKPEQVEPAYIECGNGAAEMQVSQVNLFELGPTWLLRQCK